MSESDTKLAGDVSRYLAGLGNQEDGWHVIEMAGKITRLEREVAELREEIESLGQLIDRQASLLTGVVNAIKGEPDGLTLWSHHNAPELAKGLVSKVERLSYRLDQAMHCIHKNMDGYVIESFLEMTKRTMDETPAQSLAEVRAEAVCSELLRYAEEWLEPQVNGLFTPEAVYEDIMDHASRLQELRNGEDND